MKRPSRSIVLFSMRTAMLWGGMLIFASFATATEYSKAALPFLLISPSARINGMGQAGVAIPDEPMGYYNPAAPAIYARGYNISYVTYAKRIGWLPPIANDSNYSYSGLQVGVDAASLFRSFFRKTEEGMSSEPEGWLRRLRRDVSVDAALSHFITELDMGTIVATYAYGVDIGSVIGMNKYKANNTVISANIRFIADFSAGMTFITYKSRLGSSPGIARGRARNYGLTMRIPLIKTFETLFGHSIKLPNGLKPVLVSTYGISWNNRGDGVRYSDRSESYPLPSNKKTGCSVKLGVSMNYRNISLDLFRVLIALEKERTQIADKKNGDVTDKIGIEQEVLETLVFRLGKYDDDPSHLHLNTSGITIKSDGLMKFLRSLHANEKTPIKASSLI